MLEEMAAKPGLPWYSRVSDQPCFRSEFSGEPRYQAVLDSILGRKRLLRERLPTTLERYDLIDEPYIRPTLAVRNPATR